MQGTKTIVARTHFMQLMLTVTYPGIGWEAVQKGFKGSWERLIAGKLKDKVAAGHSEAELIVESAGGDYFKAAKIILDSKIQES